MEVALIPCLRDNYAYLLWQDGSRDALVIDPSEAEPVERVLSARGLTLSAILNTHHHHDHVGGNAALVERRGKGLPVFGHHSDRGRIPEQNQFLADEQRFTQAGLSFRVLHVPGHTLGAVTYVSEGAAFTGDTLFAAGCGRLFEGTARDMYHSLNERLASLPVDTKIYCGHEYTEQNLRFAATLEPENVAIRDKRARVAELRGRGDPSSPSTLGAERATTPF
jgi:hydroxyacylglutathione hydrolase